jgi:acetyl esterase/lipase
MRLVIVAALVLLASAPAVAATDARCAALVANLGTGMRTTVAPSGLRYRILKPGTTRLTTGNVAIEHYLVCFANGAFLDASAKGQTLAFTVGNKQVVRGFEEATRSIGVGGEVVAYLPYKLAYGAKGRPPAVPPRSDLMFDIRLAGIDTVALSTLLQRAYASGGVPAMNAAFARAAATGFKGMYAAEDDLVGLAYGFLKKHRSDGAIAALKLNVARFPNSWNEYDSLGDAYRAAGNAALADANYRRALKMNPKDTNAASFVTPPTSVIPIWPGAAPGTESWTQKEVTYPKTPVGEVVMNVVAPTLTAYLPAPATATGASVIIAPGGYCVALAIGAEANDVARILQGRGIAAFVLKYRIPEKKGDGIPKDLDMDQACKYGIADGIQAVKVVRQRAVAWGIRPDRVGVMGFSAGGMIASGALLQPDVASRPNFAALLYGAPFGAMPAVPANLPPVFMGWAQDDPIAGTAVQKFYDALRAAGNKPEAHIYSAGGHGFGVKTQHTTSDRWVDEFFAWLAAQGLIKH